MRLAAHADGCLLASQVSCQSQTASPSLSRPGTSGRLYAYMYIYICVYIYICSRQDLRQPHSLARASLHRHANLQQARAPGAASLCRAKTRSRKVISSLSRHRETDVFLLPFFLRFFQFSFLSHHNPLATCHHLRRHQDRGACCLLFKPLASAASHPSLLPSTSRIAGDNDCPFEIEKADDSHRYFSCILPR